MKKKTPLEKSRSEIKKIQNASSPTFLAKRLKKLNRGKKK